MRPARSLRALLLLGAFASLSVTALHAQIQLKSGVANKLTYRSDHIPAGPGGTPSGSPTITPQYANVVETSATAGPISNSATLTARYPSTSAMLLQRASLGTAFASGVPRYSLGDRIVTPATYVNSSGVTVTAPAGFWRAQPVMPSEIVINPSGQPLKDSTGATITNTGGVIVPTLTTGTYTHFYYSPHAKQVFASEAGQVDIWWRSNLPDASNNYVLVHETFSVSSATTNPVRTLYWTEKTFNGPRVAIPSGRIVTVNPVYSNVFPATVGTEFVPVGSTPPADPNAAPAAELRTLWFDTTNGSGSLHAYNVTGRILVEYLGAVQDDGSHEFLGADIISVAQSAPASTLTVNLGEEIRPSPENRLLIPQPVNSTSTAGINYYGTTVRPDGSVAYYAEHENYIEDQVVFYWLEELDAAIAPASGNAPGLKLDWPKSLHKYLQVWPTSATAFAQYIVGHSGSSASSGTGLKFEGGKIPTVIYQDDAEQDEVVLDPTTQRLLVNFTGSSDQLSRVLLKFTGDDGSVWYVRLMTQADDRTGYVEGDGTPAYTAAAYVGERLAPPSADYSLAGFIAGGTSYSPNAYIDPFANGVSAGEKGAIIPVNALPGNGSTLEVWWFRKVSAPSTQFSDFYTTAKVARYTLSYRTDSPSIVLASNNGTYDLSAAQIAGSLYVQNDASLPGYNPNEEHAIVLNGRAYALRDDLNVTTGSSFTTFSSLPRVLIQYTDPSDNRPAMSVYQVVREDSTYTFDYPVTAGTIVNSPMPLPLLPLPVDSTTGLSRNLEVTPDPDKYPAEALSTTAPSTYGKFTFKDRKGYDWVYRGPHGDPAEASLPPFSGPLPNYEFNSGFGPWVNTNVITSPTVANGSYNGTATGNGDAYVYTNNTLTAFAGSSVATIMVRMKASANGGVQLFWGNQAGGFGGTRVMNASYTGNGDWQVVSFPVSTSADWAGQTINALRLDPVSVTGVTFSIDWIRNYQATSGLGMQWYYTMRSGFWFPGRSSQPAEGTVLPYLRVKNTDGSFVGDAVTGTPLTVAYRPTWPEAPTMSVGETLTLPNHGLPAVRGNTSAVVFYQQSIAQSGASAPNVTLHDPTRAKTVLLDNAAVGLTKIPASAAVTQQSGKTYFQLLPPHLQQRFYYDGTLGAVGGLVLIGQFNDEITGEDYLFLNTLSPDDMASLKGIVATTDSDYQKWSIAIDNLTTKVETFMEDPAKRGTYIPDSSKTVTVGPSDLAAITSSDTAVDSYALTATGAGSGYVTLVFGNGYAFTPVGDPVSVSIIKVVPQIYTGDLKTLPASNPLDEQTALRHSGDFAAHPENYEFEWRYAQPQDGVVPATYTYAMGTLVGTSPANNWLIAANPAAPLPATYATTQYPFPRTFAINNSSYSASAGYPGTVVKSVTPVTFSGTIPAQIVFSAELGTHDGFILYVNGTAAVASRVPAGVTLPNNLALTDPRTGLSSTGLTNQYYVPSTYFVTGDNRIEVALYTTANANATSSLDFRVDASVETDHVVANGSPWILPNGTLSNTVIVGGSASSPLGNPLLVFSDNYFTMRYRPKTGVTNVAGTTWSRWMEPKLVESWIKRALAGINPFTQRTDDLYNNPVSTDVSILTQAGKRWEGDVALNLNNINDFGLIEIYETLLNRAKKLSIDAGYDDPGTDDTLLLTAGYLNDLYMTLGNEASDDADNPTISIDGDLDSGQVSTSRFSFEGQVPTLIDEELALLRGRDDFLSPGTKAAPAYNRLYWNYTNGINSGESIYAINYDIKEKAGSPTANGTLDAADAQYMFPQGHGDAYGHYLTALTGYYKLLTSPHFTWTPRTESVDVLGQTVQVDYQDERKFAAAAASVARMAARIIDVTARKSYRDDPSVGWTHQRDLNPDGSEGRLNSTTNTRRTWGTDEWAARGGQGAYFNWVSANAMLLDKDTNPQHSGIQVIDRTTVPEIDEIVTHATAIQTALDDQCAHINPLGLAKGAIAFDISPTDLKAGQSHFDQIYARALQASLNAKAAFDRACVMNRTLRNQNNSLDDYNNAVDDQENAYEYQLITLFGTAYAGDIGPGKLYAQGYTGPDLYHYWYIVNPSALVDTGSTITFTYNEPVNLDPFVEWSVDNVYNKLRDPLQYTARTVTISPDRITQFSTSAMGSRSQTGSIQSALLDVYQAQVNVRAAANQLDTLMRQFDRDYQLFTEFRTAYADANDGAAEKLNEAAVKIQAAGVVSSTSAITSLSADLVYNLSEALKGGYPDDVGLATDPSGPLRFATMYGGSLGAYALQLSALALDNKAADLQAEADDLSSQADDFITQYNWDAEDKQHVVEFERLMEQVLATKFTIASRMAELQHATEHVSQLVAQGNRILSERETFRQRAAAVIQGYRTRDLTYRAFRNEELSQYQSLYDLAAQYTYLAVQSYDYETGLLGTDAGQKIIDGVISTRSLGDFKDGKPVATTGTTGDGGLASLLSRLQSDWSVAKSRLGINNPDASGTLFSLRQELFRIRTDAASTDDDKAWQQVIEQHIMSNVLNDPDVATYCRNIRKADGTSVPGIVIPFSTTITQGLNFFGRPLAAGDHAYTASNFATKIYSTGVVLDGYIGMDPYAIGVPNAGKPASSNANALSATPYVYLIPAGEDAMYMPPLGDTAVVRTWAVKDQAMPLPFNLGQDVFSANVFFTPQGTVNEQFWITRKHQAFRPVSDPAFFYSTMPAEFTNSRLVGRSVWNTQWKLVIPANTLLNAEQDGLDKFVRTVTDIRLFFRTYSNSGN
ncbi:MAG: hypothetical protein JSS11_11085 [Verrucomicrobia bacterium]|nr:hypothetical protein [Verrucomicrobiota bacterium]